VIKTLTRRREVRKGQALFPQTEPDKRTLHECRIKSTRKGLPKNHENTKTSYTPSPYHQTRIPERINQKANPSSKKSQKTNQTKEQKKKPNGEKKKKTTFRKQKSRKGNSKRKKNN